jgi:hypothetical protein
MGQKAHVNAMKNASRSLQTRRNSSAIKATVGDGLLTVMLTWAEFEKPPRQNAIVIEAQPSLGVGGIRCYPE